MEGHKNLPSRHCFSGTLLEAEHHQNKKVNKKEAAMGARKQQIQRKRSKGNPK